MIRPLPGYILISPLEEKNITAGGVYTSEKSKDKPSRGKVAAVGEKMETFSGGSEIRYVTSPVEKGQTVIYKKWTNQEVVVKGKTYLLVKFSELLGVLE